MELVTGTAVEPEGFSAAAGELLAVKEVVAETGRRDQQARRRPTGPQNPSPQEAPGG